MTEHNRNGSQHPTESMSPRARRGQGAREVIKGRCVHGQPLRSAMAGRWPATRARVYLSADAAGGTHVLGPARVAVPPPAAGRRCRGTRPCSSRSGAARPANHARPRWCTSPTRSASSSPRPAREARLTRCAGSISASARRQFSTRGQDRASAGRTGHTGGARAPLAPPGRCLPALHGVPETDYTRIPGYRANTRLQPGAQPDFPKKSTRFPTALSRSPSVSPHTAKRRQIVRLRA